MGAWVNKQATQEELLKAQQEREAQRALESKERHLLWRKMNPRLVSDLRAFASTCNMERLHERLQKHLNNQEYDEAAILQEMLSYRADQSTI